MNKTLISVISFITGVAAGGAGMYFYSKKQFEEKMHIESQELKEYYERKFQLELEDMQGRMALDNLAKEEEKKETKKAKGKAVQKVDSPEDAENRTKEEYEHIVKTDYNRISTPPKKKTTKKKKSDALDSDPAEPYMITFDEYHADRKHDKRIITLLDREDMLVDEELEPIDDGYELVGRDNLENLEFDNNGDTVYVRNDAIGTDFQIVVNVTDTYEEFLQDSVN